MKKLVTEKEFDRVKALQSMELNLKQIFGITGRNKVTLSRIMASDTFADFRKLQQSLSAKAIKEKVAPPVQATLDSNQVLINLTDAIVGMTNQWKSMEEKLDEVLETKRPWFNKAR